MKTMQLTEKDLTNRALGFGLVKSFSNLTNLLRPNAVLVHLIDREWKSELHSVVYTRKEK